MGAFKNIDAQYQMAWEIAESTNSEDMADVLRWYQAHFDKLPPELLKEILSDDEFFKRALTVWENQTPAPKPASEHVALQPEFVSRRALRKQRPSMRCVVGWSMIAASLTASVVILVVNI